MSEPVEKPIADVPQQIFEKFLQQLQEEGISAAVIERLRSIATGNSSLSEAALKKALLPDDPES